jgi:hypothetical protein
MIQVVDLRKTKKIKVKVEESTPKNSSPVKLEWIAPEFIKYKRDKNWFILPGVVALALVAIAIILKNFLFTVGIIIAAFVVYFYAVKEPRKIKFSISGKGVRVDNRIFPFEDLKSFWIFYNPPEIKELSIRSKKMFIPYIKIPLGDQNPAEVRKLLLRFIPERKHNESAVDTWARKLRF